MNQTMDPCARCGARMRDAGHAIETRQDGSVKAIYLAQCPKCSWIRSVVHKKPASVAREKEGADGR